MHLRTLAKGRDRTGTRRINAGVCAATSLLGFQSWTASARRRRVSPGLRLAQHPAVSAPRRVSAVISLLGFPSCDCASTAETCLSPGQPSGAVPIAVSDTQTACVSVRGGEVFALNLLHVASHPSVGAHPTPPLPVSPVPARPAGYKSRHTPLARSHPHHLLAVAHTHTLLPVLNAPSDARYSSPRRSHYQTSSDE